MSNGSATGNLEFAARIRLDLDDAAKEVLRLATGFDHIKASGKAGEKALDAAADAAGDAAKQMGDAAAKTEAVAEALDDAGDAAKRAATNLDGSAKAAAGAAGAEAKLEAAVDGANRAIGETASKTAASAESLDRAGAAGKRTAANLDATAQASDRTTRAQNKLKPAVDAGAKSMDKAGISAKQLAAANRMLPAQITDIVTGLASGQSVFMVAIQQGGQLKDAYGGVVPAARALLGAISPMAIAVGAGTAAIAAIGIATYQSYQELQGYERGLIATGGVVGTTAGRIADLADDVGYATGKFSDAEAATQQLVDSGRYTAESLESATRAAVAFAEITGKSIEDAADTIIELGNAPSATLDKLSKQYHFLTLEVYEHVRALEEQGRAEDAAKYATEEFARVHEARVKEARERAGSLERAWLAVRSAIGQAWQDLRNIGRDDAPFRMAEAARKMAAADAERRRMIAGGADKASIDFATKAYQAAAEEYKRATIEDGRSRAQAAERAASQRTQDKGIAASKAINAVLDDGATKTEKLAKETEKLQQQFRDLQAAAKASGIDSPTLKGVSFAADGSVSGGAYDKALKSLQSKFKEKTPRQAKPKQTEAQKDEAAAQRELENLRQRIDLVGTLTETQKRATEEARVRAAIENGNYKGATEATKAELLDQARLLDMANLRRDVDVQLLTVRQRIAALQGNDSEELVKTNAELKRLQEQFKTLGREAEAADVGKLMNLQQANATLKDLQQRYQQIIGEIGLETQRIQAQTEIGLKTEADAQQDIVNLYRSKLSVLREMVPQMRAAALALGDTEAGRSALAFVDQMQLKIEQLASTTNLLQQAVRSTFQDAFQQVFRDLADLTTSVQDDLLGFISNVAEGIAEFAEQQLSQMATNAIMGKLGELFPKLFGNAGAETPEAAAMVGAGNTAAAALVQAGTQVAAAISAAGSTAAASGAGASVATGVTDAAQQLSASGQTVTSGAGAIANSALQLANAAGGLSPGASAVIQAAIQLLTAAQAMAAANTVSTVGGGLSGGGYTGAGGKYQFADFVHKREFVNRSEVVGQPGALPFLRDFNRRGMAALRDWHGYATGGLVGVPMPPMAAPQTRAPTGGFQGAATQAPTPIQFQIINQLQAQAIGEALWGSGWFGERVMNVIGDNPTAVSEYLSKR
ncbi:phage tail length tape measure family protein [Lysobacter yananisis]|uniref:Phage tail length tape measure family protein n=1 Tax=Lysobacter yananisis TaxID=1003114 RepID=A0ABY9P8B8_9GAMM|nr:phage tail length tape measure family protein [Lysobacter yananisis]WMT03303.1 phage tail length tape measure family protein [Lysobacter yananisis]